MIMGTFELLRGKRSGLWRLLIEVQVLTFLLVCSILEIRHIRKILLYRRKKDLYKVCEHQSLFTLYLPGISCCEVGMSLQKARGFSLVPLVFVKVRETPASRATAGNIGTFPA